MSKRKTKSKGKTTPVPVARTQASASPEQASAPGNPPARKGFDWTTITDEELRARAKLLAGRARHAICRTGYQILEIGRTLRELHDMLKSQFYPMCSQEFGMDPRSARRFMQVVQFAEKKLLPAHVLDDVSPMVLYQLARGDVSVEVVEEALRQANGKVTPKDLQSALKRVEERVEERERELQDMTAELAAANATIAEAKARTDRAELEAVYMRENREQIARAQATASQEIAAYMKTYDDLRAQVAELEKRTATPTIKEVEIPKIPAAYKTLQKAIAAKEKELREAEQKASAVQDKVAQAERRLQALSEQTALPESSLDLLTRFRSDVQALSAKYAEVLAAARDTDQRVRDECAKVAVALRTFADQIEARGTARLSVV